MPRSRLPEASTNLHELRQAPHRKQECRVCASGGLQHVIEIELLARVTPTGEQCQPRNSTIQVMFGKKLVMQVEGAEDHIDEGHVVPVTAVERVVPNGDIGALAAYGRPIDSIYSSLLGIPDLSAADDTSTLALVCLALDHQRALSALGVTS